MARHFKKCLAYFPIPSPPLPRLLASFLFLMNSLLATTRPPSIYPPLFFYSLLTLTPHMQAVHHYTHTTHYLLRVLCSAKRGCNWPYTNRTPRFCRSGYAAPHHRCASDSHSLTSLISSQLSSTTHPSSDPLVAVILC